MLHILLLFLKIVGTVLLVLLGLILLVILTILIVPVRYRVAAEKYTALAARAEVSWIGRLFQLIFCFDMNQNDEKRLHIRFRLIGLTLFDNQRPKKEHIKKSKRRKTKKQEEKTTDFENSSEKTVVKERQEEESTQSQTKETKIKNTPAAEKSVSDKKDKFRRWQSNCKEKIESVGRIFEKKDKLMSIYHDERNHQWFMRLGTRIKKLLIALMPDIDRLFWHFGFDDPATTGKVLGALSVFYPACQERMVLHPEFESEIMEGEVAIHGKIRILTIAVFMIRSFLNKQFFGIVKQVKNI